MKRRAFVLAAGAGFAAAFARAQPPERKIRIGVLGLTTATGYAAQVDAFRQGMRDLGYVEGKNLALEFRWAEGKYERLDSLLAELVALRVDVVLTHGGPGTVAASRSTAAIPVVFAVSGDVVGMGLVASLARPGGNMTGSIFFVNEMNAKRLSLIKEVMPRAKRVGILAKQTPGVPDIVRLMERTAKSLQVELQVFNVAGPAEFDAAFSEMAKKHIDAAVIIDNSDFVANAKSVAESAAAKRIASIGFSGYAEAGGTLDYGADFLALWRRAAYFVDKIVRGARPGDLPIEQAAKFELGVNLRNAKALGIRIPQAILQRADRVIE